MTICVGKDLFAVPVETTTAALGEIVKAGRMPREELRHILLGSPEAIRQEIHHLHVLNYAESVLWSPVTAVGDRMILTPALGEAMSLLRRSR